MNHFAEQLLSRLLVQSSSHKNGLFDFHHYSSQIYLPFHFSLDSCMNFCHPSSTQKRHPISLEGDLSFALVTQQYHSLQCCWLTPRLKLQNLSCGSQRWRRLVGPLIFIQIMLKLSLGARTVTANLRRCSWGRPRVYVFLGFTESFHPFSFSHFGALLLQGILKPIFPRKVSFVSRSVNQQRRRRDQI